MRCAVKISRGMADREHEVPADRRIRFRIGINVGDLIAEEQGIFGDGANIARGWRVWPSRTASASAASCAIRSRIRSITPSKISASSRSRTSRGPVRVYAFAPRSLHWRASGKRVVHYQVRRSSLRRAFPSSCCPFANFSNAAEQQYFAGGITEDVTTDLSRLAGVLVISC